MKLYLNDLSISGQCIDKNHAIDLLKKMTKTFVEARGLAENEDGYFHDSILDRIIYPEVTLKHFISAILNDSDPRDKDIKRLCHSIIFRKPKKGIMNSHNDPDDAINLQGLGSVKNTCFDCACDSKAGALFVSMENENLDQIRKLQVSSTKYGKKLIYNIYSPQDVEDLKWHYEHNPKHGKKDKLVNNKIESGMSLSHDKITYTLKHGIKVQDKIYGHFEDCIYKFHRHENNKYHAFAYKLQDNDADDLVAKGILTQLGGDRMGQIFAECL